MNGLLRDLRIGVRTAFRSPGYSVVAIVTIALAIAANTLLFSLASPLVVRPLPIGDPDSLGWLRQTNGPRGISVGRSSMPDFLDFRESARSFSSMAAREVTAGTLVGHGDARRVSLMRVTTNLPTVWGLVPHQGRFFLAGEDAVGRPPVDRRRRGRGRPRRACSARPAAPGRYREGFRRSPAPPKDIGGGCRCDPGAQDDPCLLYTSPTPRDPTRYRMPTSA